MSNCPALRMAVLLSIPLLLLGDSLRLKRVAELPYGAEYGRLLCGDTDHDSLSEMIFAWSFPAPHWAVWEYEPVSQYHVVYADTWANPPWPPGIDTGSFYPWDIGDIDRDGLRDLLGYHVYCDSYHYRFVLGVMESPDPHSYPARLVWWTNLAPYATADYVPCYLSGDLDGDDREDMYCNDCYEGILYIFENSGNNQNRVAWLDSSPRGGPTVAFGDFDLDSSKEWVSAGLSAAGLVWLYENRGNDSFALSWTDTVMAPNGIDAFSGDDVDQDGKPEFFISFAWYGGTIAHFRLFAWETVGDNAYERCEVDTVTRDVGSGWWALSRCGDIDADGVEEICWSLGNAVYVYDGVADNHYELVWMRTDLPRGWNKADICVYDENANGYQELVVSGSGYTWLFELEALQVLNPNGGQSLVPGETCQIHWRVYTPPRCDSVSLFLKTDTTIYPGERFWRLDTIVTGLASTDSVYPWVVPSRPSSMARVVAIAYGPGWQYDESDSSFRIVGIEEVRPAPVRDWALSVSPNPARGRAIVSYDVPRRSAVSLGLYDASGRLIRELASGEKLPGTYEVTKTIEPDLSPEFTSSGLSQPPGG